MSSKMSQFATVFFICNYLIFQGGLVQVSATTQMREAEVGCHEDSCGTQGDVIIREEEEGNMKDIEMGLLQNRVKKVHTTGRAHGGKSVGNHPPGYPFGLNTSQSYGTSSGDEFDDYEWSGLQAFGIKRIQMWYCLDCGYGEADNRERLCSIQVTYKEGLVKDHGEQRDGPCTETTIFDLDEHDVITQVYIVHNEKQNLISGLMFFTNSGRKSKYVGPQTLGYNQTLDEVVCDVDRYFINHCEAFPKDLSISPTFLSNGIFSFKGFAGANLNSLQLYYADSVGTCNAIKKVTGGWQPFYYNNGAFTIELQEGTTHENEEVNNEEWGKQASLAVEAGFEFESFFYSASASVRVEAEFSQDIGKEYRTAFTSSTTKSSSVSFDTGGQLWAWVFTTLDSCKGKSTTFKDYVMTRNLEQPPCCLVGHAKDVYTQFGPCSEGKPQMINKCISLGLTKHPDYGVQYPDNTVVDQNLKFGDKDINIRLTHANKSL